MTRNSTYCLIISAYIFLERTLHYVCNIITDNVGLEWIQKSGGNDMLGISIKLIVC